MGDCRAAVQSITIDEADTYLGYVARSPAALWYPAANNHLLNSLLMRLSTSVFGLSTLTARMPALLGVAIFIAVAYRLSVTVTGDRLLQWSIFVCLVCNPFVFDYLVAARGYGLALAFLPAAITIAASHCLAMQMGERSSAEKTCSLISACLALSVASNLSFAFVDCTAFFLLGFWVIQRSAVGPRRLVIFLLVPGTFVSLLLPAQIVLHWPRAELVYGGRSLVETFRSVAHPSFPQPNPSIMSPLLNGLSRRVKSLLLPALALFSLGCLVVRWRNPKRPEEQPWAREFLRLTATLLVVTLVLHTVARYAFGVLLPLARTALFIPLLCVLGMGLLGTLSTEGRLATTSRRGLRVTLGALAIYFLFCTRLDHFAEWEYNSEVKDVYQVVAFLNQRANVTKVPSNWRYNAALNFYRLVSGGETTEEIHGTIDGAYPPGAKAYVLFAPDDVLFVQKQGLRLAFRGRSTDVIVAVAPELALDFPPAYRA